MIRLHVLPVLGKVELVDLTKDRLESLIRSLRVAPNTVKGIVIIIKAALKTAFEDGLITTNPATRLRATKITQDTHLWSHLWTPAEWATFIEHTESPFKEAFKLLLALGCRRGELMALTWSDVNFETGTVYISKSMNGDGVLGPTKTGQGRAVQVDAATLVMLREMKRTGPPLFNFSPRQLGNVFRATVKRADLRPMRLHDVRHLAATMMLRAGVNVKVVSKRLGHARVGITMDTYMHVAEDQDQEAAEKMAALFA